MSEIDAIDVCSLLADMGSASTKTELACIAIGPQTGFSEADLEAALATAIENGLIVKWPGSQKLRLTDAGRKIAEAG